MESILVTGVGGSVGQYIGNALAHAGYQVTGIYRSMVPRNADYRLVKADIADEPLQMGDIGVDVVIHIAAGLAGTARKLVHDNIGATANLVSFAERVSVKKFIYMSTVSVHGNAEGEVSEHSGMINPECYGMTKYLAECLVRESAVANKLVIRLPRMLGPFVDMADTRGSGFLTMAKKILEGEDVTCFIPDVEYNNYLHVEELGEFLKGVIPDSGWSGNETVLLGAGERLTMLEILRIMKKEIGSRSEIIAEDRGTAPKCSLVDIGAAKRLGFCPHSAEEMLKKFIREVYMDEGNKAKQGGGN